MSRGAVTEGGGGVEETKADAETLMVSASTGRGKKSFNLYGCDLSAPRERIAKLCENFPTIGKAIDKWRKARMEDPELQAKYANLEEFVDFSLSQFLHLTSEFTVTGSDKKIFYRNANFEYDRELRDGFENVIKAIRKEIPEDGSNPALQAVVGWWHLHGSYDDQKKAVEFFKVAARRLGYDPAIEADAAAKAEYAVVHNSLAMCYQNGIGDERKDKSRVRRFYYLAAQSGYSTAQGNFAYLCLEEGGEEEARRLFQLAADQGDAMAQRKLADLYLGGIGGEKDEVKARNLYQEAADRGEVKAQHALACLCLQGIGGEKDEVKARKFYRLAADRGFEGAREDLAYLCREGIGGEVDEMEARRLLFENNEDWFRKKVGSHEGSLGILLCSQEVAIGSRYAIERMESTFSKFKIDKSSQPLTKDEIIEIINNLAPQEQREGKGEIPPELKRGVRIFNKNSHLIGDLVEVSKDRLEVADLFEIHEHLSEHLAAAGIDPMKSKSCIKIRECIAERIKSEIGENLVGEIKFSDFHGTALSFSITSKEAKAMKEAGARTTLLSDVGGAGGAESAVTLDGRLGDMHRGGELAYDRERGIITVTKTHLEKFSTRSVPTADVGGAGASAVAGGAAVARGGGGRD